MHDVGDVEVPQRCPDTIVTSDLKIGNGLLILDSLGVTEFSDLTSYVDSLATNKEKKMSTLTLT